MRFEEVKTGEILVVKVLDNRIAADVSPRFKAQLKDYIEAGNRAMVLDLSAVTFIESRGLGAMITALKSLGKDANLVISGAQGAVASMFKLTRMDKVFRMFDTAGRAEAALQSAASARGSA